VTTERSAEIAASGPLHAPFPSYVQSEQERQRWKVCAALALAASIERGPDGRPNSVFVWHGTRGLYHSEMSAGDPEPEAVAAVDEFLANLAPLFP
jgi:hypothetical protein